MKKILSGIKGKMMIIGAGASTALMAVPVFAAEPDVAAILGTAATSVESNVMSAVSVVVPVAAGISGVFVACRLGWKFFKSVAR